MWYQYMKRSKRRQTTVTAGDGQGGQPWMGGSGRSTVWSMAYGAWHMEHGIAMSLIGARSVGDGSNGDSIQSRRTVEQDVEDVCLTDRV
jgi:hypothetical protein